MEQTGEMSRLEFTVAIFKLLLSLVLVRRLGCSRTFAAAFKFVQVIARDAIAISFVQLIAKMDVRS